MDERILSAAYFQYSPSPHSSPHHSVRSSSASFDRERYLAELLVERQKLGPFVQVLPFCNRLVNQELVRVTGLAHNQNFASPERIDHGSPMRLAGHPSNGGPMDLEGWPGIQTEEEKLRDKPGYEHLNELLHVLVEAELPEDIIDTRLSQAVAILKDLLKPVDESHDFYKNQQLRELAMLNGTPREESPHMSPSASPFNSTGMKRAKTGR